MLHNSSSKRSIVTCLPTGKSTALGWRVGCSSSDQLTMFQKPRSGNMCKKGYFPIGGYEGKRKKLTGLPFRRNVTNCGSMQQGRKGLIRSPSRSGTAGLTLSDQINNTTLNTLHGVWRSDPPPFFFSPLGFVFLISTILVSCAPCPWAPCSDLPPLATVWWGSFCGLFGVQFPSWPPPLFVVWSFVCVFMVWAVLSLPSVCPWFRVSFPLVPGSCLWCFLLCLCFCLRFCGCLFLWPLCASLGVVGLLCVCPFLGCCWLSSPVSCCLPPPVVGPLWCPGPVFVLVPPSGYLVAFATARLPCLNAWGVVVLCRPLFILSHGSKGLWPCVGFVLPSTPCCRCCCGALYSYAEVFICRWSRSPIGHR